MNISPFVASDGRLIIPKRHIATFQGKHNKNKAKVLIFLYYVRFHGFNKSYGAQELSIFTGCPYQSVLNSLGKWYKWRYLDRRAVGADGMRPHYAYTIGERGVHFIKNRIPPDKFNQYVKELNDHLATFSNKRIALHKK